MLKLRNSPVVQQAWSLVRHPFMVGLKAAIVAAVISLFIRNTYTSRVELLPVSQGNVGNLVAAAAAMGLNLPTQGADDSVYPDIVRSRMIIVPLLTKKYTFHEPAWRFGTPVLKEETLLEYLEKKNLDRGYDAISKVLDCQRDIKSGITTIQVETRSQELSQQVAEQAVRLLQDFLVNQTMTKGGQKAAFVENRLVEAQKAYEQAESRLIAFETSNLNASASSSPSIRLLDARLNADLTNQRQIISNLFLMREQSLLDKANDVPVLNVLEHANAPIEKSGPVRSLITLVVFFFGGLVTLLWDHRDWIRQKMTEN